MVKNFEIPENEQEKLAYRPEQKLKEDLSSTMDSKVAITREEENKIGNLIEAGLKPGDQVESSQVIDSDINVNKQKDTSVENKEQTKEAGFIREDGREIEFMNKVQQITGLSEEEVRNVIYSNQRLFNKLFSETEGPNANKKFESLAFSKEDREAMGLPEGANMYDVMVRAFTKFVDASPNIHAYQPDLEAGKQLSDVMGEAKRQIRAIIGSYHQDFLWGNGTLTGEYVDAWQTYGSWWPAADTALDEMDWTVLGAYTVGQTE